MFQDVGMLAHKCSKQSLILCPQQTEPFAQVIARQNENQQQVHYHSEGGEEWKCDSRKKIKDVISV